MSVQKRCAYCACEITRPASVEDVHVPPDSCIPYLADRIAKLEAQLGAVDRTSVVAEALPAVDATASTVAPSVLAQRWNGKAILLAALGDPDSARACDLAAAVTEWYKRPQRGDDDEADLYDLIRAFVRGEPLPQKGG